MIYANSFLPSTSATYRCERDLAGIALFILRHGMNGVGDWTTDNLQFEEKTGGLRYE